MRREYVIEINVNGVDVTKAIIDPHYEEKHSENVNDEIILELINSLNGKLFEPEEVKEPYSYFVTDGIEYEDKLYKLIWLLEQNDIYIGIVNAYRRRS